MTDEQKLIICDAAREMYAAPSDDNIEVDSNAEIHPSEDDGYWVQAWVYVRKEDLPPS